MSAFVLPVALGFVAAMSCMAQPLIDELTPEQRRSVTSGQTVVNSTEIEGKAWPKLRLYRIVKAPPAAVEALLVDFKSAPSYTPGMLNAEIVASPAEGIKDVRYTVKVPVLSKISYVVRNYYERSGNRFSVRWELVESPIASESTGSLRVEPFDEKSLLSYTNQVTPSVPMAGMLKGQAAKEAVTTIEAIATEAERRAGASR